MNSSFRYARGLSYTVILLLIFIIEDAVLPPVFGVVPCLLLPFTVAVGMCEGPYMGAGYGVAAGLLMDFTTGVVGFSSILLLCIGTASGLVIAYFRMSKGTALAFTAVAGALFFVLKWFFVYYLWQGYGMLHIAGLQILFSSIAAIPVYMLVHFASKKYGSLKNG